ncbi:MAG: glycosyltransferase [Planctomycetota bacterium]
MPTLLQTLKKHPLAQRLNAALKAPLQERRAARSLRWCRDEAKRKGRVELDEPALTLALRTRLQNRPHPVWPKPKGSLHVFMMYWLENWEFVLPISMQPFGKVTVFDWRAHGFDSRSKNWLIERDAMNDAMLRAFHAANAEQPVDAVIGYVSGHTTSPETLREMSRAGAAIFNMCFDDKLHMPGRVFGGRDTSPAGIASTVDLNLTNSPESVIKYYAFDGLGIFCPQGAQPDIHTPQPGGFKYDVSFVGAKYGWRSRLIEALTQRGIHVECFGKGWPNGMISDADLIAVFSHSRINIGMAGVAHSNTLCCLKGRDYEIPMCGGLYLTQDHSDLPFIYNVGTEIAVYRDADDCAAQIRALLADPKRADAIRQAGHHRARSTHSWEACWDRVFKIAGIIA